MKKVFFIGALVAALASTSAFAETTKNINKKAVSQWSCEEFLAIDDTFYPTAIGAAEIINQKGKVEDPTLNISGIQTTTPLIIEECKKDPTSSFIKKVENLAEKYRELTD